MAKVIALLDLQSDRIATLEAALLDANYEVVPGTPPLEACDADAIVVDVGEAGRAALMNSASHLSALKNRQPVIFLLGASLPEWSHEARRAGAAVFRVTGFSPGLLRSIIETNIHQHAELQALRDELQEAKKALMEY